MNTFHKIPPTLSTNIKRRSRYGNYKDDLVRDFHHCCGYCDDSDLYIGGKRFYQIDHFAPKSLFAELENEYSNLVYSCPFCNRAKSNKWLGTTSTENIVDNKGFINPHDPDYGNHLKRDNDGKIIPLDTIGEYMYNELNLGLVRHQIIYKLDIIFKKLEDLKGKIKLKQQNKQTNDSEYTHLLETYFLITTDFFDYYLNLNREH